MEDRIGQLEVQLQQSIGELQRLQTSERQLIGEVTRLRSPPTPSPQQAAQAAVGAMAGIDTRTLGKPDTFRGEEANWADWRVIAKAYFSVVSIRTGTVMTAQEGSSAVMAQATLTDPVDQAASGPASD